MNGDGGVSVSPTDPWVTTSGEDAIVVYSADRTPENVAAARAVVETLRKAADFGPLVVLIDVERGVYAFQRSRLDAAFLDPDETS